MKTCKRDIQIPCFPGFYESLWRTLYDSECEYEKEKLAEYGADGDLLCFLDATDRSWKDYTVSVAKEYSRFYTHDISTALDVTLTLCGYEIDSPREYNFLNDRLYCRVEFNISEQDLYARMIEITRRNYDTIAGMIRGNHTSCDGFVSFMSNDIEDWLKPDVLASTDDLYFDYLLYYITLSFTSFRNGDDYSFNAYEWITSMGQLDIRIEFEGCNAEWQRRYEEVLAKKEEAEDRVRHSVNYPRIPGL